MIIVAIAVSALVLYVRRRDRGRLLVSDFGICVVYVGVAVLLTLLASRALTQAFTMTCSAVGLVGVYMWHRKEVHAGRRDPVWFAKH